MNSLRLRGGTHYAEGTETEISIRDGLITDDGAGGAVFDASGLIVAPGLIDLQVNGGFGLDITTNPTSLWEIGRQLPRYGVTAFLPTVVSSSTQTVRVALETIEAGPPAGWQGATPLGIHAEGPMLSPFRRGAHRLEALVSPAADPVSEWGHLRHLRMVTLAPELHGASAMVRRLVALGVVVSVGHSDADYSTTVRSFEWGVTHGTHLFNAMSGYDHHAPGMAAALLATKGVSSGLIVDGEHVHPAVVAIAWAAQGPDGLVLVTDAMAAMGVGDGDYKLGDVPVVVRGTRAENPEGRLAGSVLTMDEAMRNLIRFTGCDPGQAITAASTIAARIVGDAERGALRPGQRGDITLFDQSLQVRATIVGGAVVHDARPQT